MTKILIVDDEPELLELLALVIQGEFGPGILQAASGKEALNLIALNNDVELVISDWNMKGGGGDLILAELKKRGTIPFILMSGDFHLERELVLDAQELPFFKVLEKPFELDQLIKTIRQALSAKQGPREESAYCCIRLESIIFEPSISYALYLKLGESKFVKIIREGEQTLSDIIQHYRQKKVSAFYMKREDFKLWLQDIFKPRQERLKASLKPGEKSLAQLSEVGRRFHTRFHLSLHTLGVDEAHYRSVAEVLEEVASELHERPDLSELLNLILSGENYLSDHSFFIIFLASYLARDLGLSGRETTKKIVYAAFFHDLALEHSELALNEAVPELNSNQKERAEIYAHPQKIIQQLGKFPELGGDVTHMILEHHELPDGSGYPNQLDAGEIHPLSCLFILCHVASELFLARSMRSEEVAQAFSGELGERYNCGNFRRPLQVMRSHFKK